MSQTRRFGACKAPFDECGVTLAIYGEPLDPPAVSELLGVEPTASRRRGEHAAPASLPADHGTWLFSIESVTTRGPSELALELLDRFPSDPALWDRLCREYDVQVRFAFQASTLTGCFELSPAAVERLGKTGATVAFHLYAMP